MTTWARRLALAVDASFHGDVPDDVLERASVHVLDALACAAGAADSTPMQIVRRAVAGSSPNSATMFFTGVKANVPDAVLVNGTAVRYLDANDVFLGTGPGGHPSDNISAALNVAETTGSSGRDVLCAIVIGYDLVAALRRAVYRGTPRGSEWHEVSLSGVVVASMTALLRGADVNQLTDAIAIAASKGYALKEIRRGEISMMKACANAMIARDGLLAAELAMHGMTGPANAFEGSVGLVRTFGGEPTTEMLEDLTSGPAWAIRRVSIKPYPALGTSQAAITAAARIADDVGPFTGRSIASIDSIEIRLPDTAYTREYIGLLERQRPTTRESADHSIQFLVALALCQGDVLPEDYDSQRWLDDDMVALMARTTVVANADLDESAVTAFPAEVAVTMGDGQTTTHRVTAPPGSPDAVWHADDVVAKFVRLDRTGRSEASIQRIAAATSELVDAADVGALMAAVA